MTASIRRGTGAVVLGLALAGFAAAAHAQDLVDSTCEQACEDQQTACDQRCAQHSDPVECESACEDQASDCVNRCEEDQ